MKYGDMTPAQRQAAVRKAAGRLQRELQHPAMVAAIGADLPAAPVPHPAGCGPDCAGFCLIDGVPCGADGPVPIESGHCPECGVEDGRPCAFSCSISGAQFEDA